MKICNDFNLIAKASNFIEYFSAVIDNEYTRPDNIPKEHMVNLLTLMQAIPGVLTESNIEYIVLMSGNKIIASVEVSGYKKVIPVLTLFVDEKHRRKGYGSILMQEIHKRTKGDILVEISPKNKPMLDLMTKLRYRVVLTMTEGNGAVLRTTLKPKVADARSRSADFTTMLKGSKTMEFEVKSTKDSNLVYRVTDHLLFSNVLYDFTLTNYHYSYRKYNTLVVRENGKVITLPYEKVTNDIKALMLDRLNEWRETSIS